MKISNKDLENFIKLGELPTDEELSLGNSLKESGVVEKEIDLEEDLFEILTKEED